MSEAALSATRRSASRRAAIGAVLAGALCGLAAPAWAGSIDLTSGTSGTFLLGQSFNETRAADVTVLSASSLQVDSMTLKGLSLGGASSALVGARIYSSSSGSLVSSGNMVVTSAASPITVPIVATLAPASSYRLAFFVQTSPPSLASGNLFDPVPAGTGGFPYVEATGQLRINGGFQLGSDAFPTTPSATTIAQISLDTAPSTVDLTTGTAGAFTPVGQSFNETRGVEVTVLATTNLQVVAMRLAGLSLGGASSALVGARIYASPGGSLVASADTTVTSAAGPITVPISATLLSGSAYRVAFFVGTTPASLASGTMFDPAPPSLGGFPYTEATGELRVDQAYSVGADAFPTNPNIFVPLVQVDFGLGQWADLGHALAGGAGVPKLVGTGTLVGQTFVTSTVTKLLPNDVATLVVGFAAINATFKGGVWVPSPNLVVPGIPTGPQGMIDLPGTWPLGIPSGFTFYEQYWQKDTAAVKGFAASNAISGTTP